MKHLLKRGISLITTLFIVSLVTFFAFNVIPGDPAEAMLGTQATPASLAALRAQLGLNQDIVTRYLHWLGGLFTGHLGSSFQYSQPVGTLILHTMPVTLWLTLLSLILIIVLSLPLGILSAKRRGGVIDKAINFISQISFSIPPFFLGLILILVFGIILRLFIPGAYVSYSDNFGGFIVYLIFPALAIALPKTATVIKFLRASLLEQLKSDYVRTARSKGSSDNRLLYRHVLRNAIIPVTALLGMIIADILAGSIIIEQVFGLPGMGRLLISAISSRDFPLAQSMVVLIAFVVVFVNFLVDISIQLIDRRIKVN